jgi:Lar family restriction alleviation protein
LTSIAIEAPEKLLPCPFCGWKNLYLQSDSVPGATWNVFCDIPDCGAEGPHADSEAAAITGWNKREGPGKKDDPSLEQLLRRVLEAKGHDPRIDVMFHNLFYAGKGTFVQKVTGSVDAIVELIERDTIKGELDCWSLFREVEENIANIGWADKVFVSGHAATPALALCTAYLKAKIEMKKRGQP